MRGRKFKTWGLIAVLACALAPVVASAEPHGPVVPVTSIKTLRDFDLKSPVDSAPVPAVELSAPFESTRILPLPVSGGVAGAPTGSTRVYGNEINPVQNIFGPGANQRVADDLTLANGACNAVYYNLAVYGNGPLGTSFNVHTELWTGDPCAAGSSLITGTAADFIVTPTCPVAPCGTGQNPATRAFELEAEITPAIPIPAVVWMAVTFSRSDAFWIVAQQAEIGSTQNSFSENDTDRNPDVCGLFNFVCPPNNPTCTPPYAGFWANIHCETVIPPNGACCNGTTCTQKTQANCLSPSVWQGAFTTCQPNACLTGACCTGTDFETCADTNQPGCPDGLFRPGAVCADTPCGENFEIYRNDFSTRIFVPIDAGQKWGDDLVFGAGIPCELTAYEVLLAGDDSVGPATFSAHVELWTNNDRGTPGVDGDDIPLAVIPGTQRDFTNLPADLTRQQLVAGPFSGLVLPPKAWMVVTTSSDNAGPLFGGLASVGFSQDGFKIFNHSSAPNAWSTDAFIFGNGFDPTFCPSGSSVCPPNCCVPAGSFRAIVWCEGAPPIGACCNDVSGTCTDDVLPTECEGRWMQNVTCDESPFNPPCGNHACCFPHPVNHNTTLCSNDFTPEECEEVYDGASAPGLFCVDLPTCPRTTCLNRDGNCFLEHAGGGCESAFCCEKVCAATPSCCSGTWTDACAQKARDLCSSDHCADALPLSGEGTYAFDTNAATTDGPAHAACENLGGDAQIEDDVWFCWTADCTGTVYARTCGQTTMDTKLAVYDGCTCPPDEADLLDCGDDRCSLQSTAVFHAVAGNNYLIRLGNYPDSAAGTGTLSIACEPPNHVNCPATGDCCAGVGTPGCANEACCDAVCGCDSYCCDTDWDASCATTGLGGSGCGADILCPALCGACPTGTVAFYDPPPGILDAGRPFPPNDSTQLLGIDTIRVGAPPGADILGCWSVCETTIVGSANGVASVSDNGDGDYTIRLARPITPGAVTKITYAGNGSFARYIAHPANLSATGTASSADVDALVNYLNGTAAHPPGLLSADVNRSGTVTGADILDAVGLLIGEGQYTIWNNSTLPTPNANCP